MINLSLQFIAAAILLVGLWLMGNHRKSGPFLAAFSELLWIGLFIPYQMWGGVFLSTVLFVMQVRNFVQWHGEGLKW
jgi:hypothetical protein